MTTDAKRHFDMKKLLPLILVIALAIVFSIDHFFFPPPAVEFQGRREMMDTSVTIIVYASDEKKAETAIDAAFNRMSEIEQIASIYDSSSEAFHLNLQGQLDNPSSELWEIITTAKECYELTKGTFDITVEPLLELWRYKPDSQQQFWELEPSEQQEIIADTLPLIGADKITLSTTPYYSVSLAPGTKITLGGLAKGYIVDQGLAMLRAAGIQHALINAGGDIGVFGGKPEGKWEIVLRDPNNPDNHLAHFLLGDGALATSGNYERYFDKEAEVGHIIDPRTGYSSHGSSSATVISPTCVQADCLATATFVLGPTEGITLIDSLPDVEALIVDYEEPSQIYTSSGLSIYEDKK